MIFLRCGFLLEYVTENSQQRQGEVSYVRSSSDSHIFKSNKIACTPVVVVELYYKFFRTSNVVNRIKRLKFIEFWRLFKLSYYFYNFHQITSFFVFLFLSKQFCKLVHKSIYIFKLSVYRSKTNISNFIKFL